MSPSLTLLEKGQGYRIVTRINCGTPAVIC
jgi:hypothetical protein